uniref:ribonuclease H n=1 Tax=Takifugu rubripes TaxID=31033 RepID=A0A674P2V2_TAKRU
MTVLGNSLTFLVDTGAGKSIIRDPIALTPTSTQIFVRSANGLITKERMSVPVDVCDPVSGITLKAPFVISTTCPLMIRTTAEGVWSVDRMVNLWVREGEMCKENIFLTQEEEETLKELPPELRSEGWKDADVGLIKGAEPVKIIPKSDYRPFQRQYPLKTDAQEGIVPIFNSLLKAGVIRECPESPVNTPLFPVRKSPPSTGWRMVQDLQAVNAAVVPRSPLVADPYTLLNDLNPEHQWYTVIDVSNAFFSVPVHPDSQFWFAFTFQGQRYTWTRLPQGYCESPTIFSQVMMSSLAKFKPPCGSQILVYVDDILMASKTEADCWSDTLALLHWLAAQGHRLSKSKLQLVKQKVIYLGHVLTHNGKAILESRKTAVWHPEGHLERQWKPFCK